MSGFIKKWIRNDRGATAVEFALVAVPFTFLLIGIIEMSLMFAAMCTLHGATNDAARLIRTGQVQQAASNPEQLFHDLLCQKASTFLSCSKIQYEVVKMNNFSDFASYPPTFDEDGNLISQGFDPGGVDDVVLIRAVYRYPLLTPLVGKFLSDGPGNTRLIETTVVLETEPYDVTQVVNQL